MNRSMINSFAAVAAVILALTSIGTIVTVPPASAQSVGPVVELA
jgi:hypothetical protein